MFYFHSAPFYCQIKSKVGNILDKTTGMCVNKSCKIENSVPPKDGGGFTIFKKFKSFEGPVLNCRVSTNHRGWDLNELVIQEIRKNTSAIFHKFLSTCCEIRIRPVVLSAFVFIIVLV